MEIKAYSPNEVVNLLYKVVNSIENIYIDGIKNDQYEPKMDVYNEYDMISRLMKMENCSDQYKQSLREGLPAYEIYKALGELYFAFYDVTRIYEEDIPERISNLRSQICATDKTMRVSDSLYEYYKNVNDVSDRQILYKILANRLIIALKQDDKPYAFGIKFQNKYNMGRFYYEHCKDKSTGFSYTIPGFVEVPEYVDKLRELALEGVKVVDKDEQDIER